MSSPTPLSTSMDLTGSDSCLSKATSVFPTPPRNCMRRTSSPVKSRWDSLTPVRRSRSRGTFSLSRRVKSLSRLPVERELLVSTSSLIDARSPASKSSFGVVRRRSYSRSKENRSASEDFEMSSIPTSYFSVTAISFAVPIGLDSRMTW